MSRENALIELQDTFLPLLDNVDVHDSKIDTSQSTTPTSSSSTSMLNGDIALAIEDDRISTDHNRPSFDYDRKLLNALKTKNIKQFVTCLKCPQIDIDRVDEIEQKTCLEIACAQKNSLKFVDLLLKAGANCKKIHNRCSPLHVAIENENIEVVERLLRDPNIDVEIIKVNQQLNKPICFLIETEFVDREFRNKCLKLLLRAGADPNFKGLNYKRALDIAVEKRQKETVETLFDYSEKTIKANKELREKINELRLYHAELPLEIVQSSAINKLFNCIRKKSVPEFERQVKKIMRSDESRQEIEKKFYALMKNTIEHKQTEMFDILLKTEIYFDSIDLEKKILLIDFACDLGNESVLNELLRRIEIDGEVSASRFGDGLNAIALKYLSKYSDRYRNLKLCIYRLIENKYMAIDRKSEEGNTILYYVSNVSDPVGVSLCLKAGASVAIRNNSGEHVFSSVKPADLEKGFDACVECKNRQNEIDYEITFDYRLLVPAKEADCRIERSRYSETAVLLDMASNDDYRCRLKHPVIKSFVFLKWHRIRWWLHPCVILYTLFCTVLVAYSYLYTFRTENSRVAESIVIGLFYTALFLFILSEIFQARLFRQYVRQFENVLDVTIIVLCLFIAFSDSKTHYFAIAVVMSFIRLVFYLEKYPPMSEYVSMFKTVSWSFLKFIPCYCVVLLSFAWGFYISLRDKRLENGGGGADQNDTNLFSTVPGSFFKSIVMSTGEYSIEEIGFGSCIDYFIFVLFVFLVSIVLFNLLNGLAVSDIQKIKDDAEIYGFISLIEQIAYLENVIGEVSEIWFRLTKRHIRNKYLFPDYLRDKRIHVFPNLDGTVIVDCERPDSSTFQLDKQIIKKAIKILNERSDGTD